MCSSKIVLTSNIAGEQGLAFVEVKKAISTASVIVFIILSDVEICPAFDQLNEITGVTLKAGENNSETVLLIETRSPVNFSSYRIPEINLLILDFPECSLGIVGQFLSLKERAVKGVTIDSRGSGASVLSRISIEMDNLDYYMEAHGNVLAVHMAMKGIYLQNKAEKQVNADNAIHTEEFKKMEQEPQVFAMKKEPANAVQKQETQIVDEKAVTGTQTKDFRSASVKVKMEKPRRFSKTTNPDQKKRKSVKKPASLNSITWIGFKQFKDYSRVFIKTNSTVDYTVRESENEIVLDLKNTINPLANNRRSLDTSFFSSAPVKITPISVEKSVKIKITLKVQSNYKIMSDNSMITVDFPLLEQGR